MNNLVCVGEHMNFMYLSKFLILSYMKLDSVVLDDVVLDVVINILYGLIKITSSFSAIPFLFDSLFCSLFLYNFWIS